MGTLSLNKLSKQNYIGRFAPSPTGPLHYGSLIAAVASFLQAKHLNGQWLVRIEDIDPPREVQGAADDILRTLERYQFEWDEAPLYQSTRYDVYRGWTNKFKEKGLIYACACSRKQIQKQAQETIFGKRYPGTCRNRFLDLSNTNHNLRLCTSTEIIRFTDAVFGKQQYDLLTDIGDFIIYRKFELPTYALATTIDDAHQGITEVVRGHDLLAFTPLQIYLCKLLEFPIPNFLHLPIIINKDGHKLSKQSRARALPKNNCAHVLIQALRDLGQDIPNSLVAEKLNYVWKWAIENWDVTKIPRHQTIPFILS